jgi:cytochrome b561
MRGGALFTLAWGIGRSRLAQGTTLKLRWTVGGAVGNHPDYSGAALALRGRSTSEMTALRYTRTAIVLHWASAVLILCGFSLGLFMIGLEFSPAKFRLYAVHKWIGITVFLVAAARLAWRAAYPAPPLLSSMPAWQEWAARATQASLYALMLAIPISGWIYSSATGVSVVYLGLFPLPDLIPKDRETAKVLLLVHKTLNFTLAAAVTLHSGAALWHHFVDRDGVMARMLPGR